MPYYRYMQEVPSPDPGVRIDHPCTCSSAILLDEVPLGNELNRGLERIESGILHSFSGTSHVTFSRPNSRSTKLID